MRSRAAFLLSCLGFAFLLITAARRDSAASPADAPGPAGNFVDVTPSSGVRFRHIASHTSKKYLPETMGSGVALFDYDNDGRLDIFLVNGAPLADPTPPGTIPQKTGPEHWNRLFHQLPGGTFEDVTVKAGLQGVGYGMGAAVGDFDNDGYEDLYVTAYGGNKLYHNNGDGTFTDVTVQAGVAGGGWSTSAAWVDLDNDGLLDLIVLRYLDWDFADVWCGEHKEGYRAYCHPDTFKAISPLVYHNDGHGRFTEVAHKIGLGTPGKGLGIALADYDRDGRIDLFFANDSMPEFLYHNKGGGTFEEQGLLSQTAVDEDGRTFAGMGVDFADFDNDGLPDLVVDDLANQMYAIYRNSGGGQFTYITRSSGVGRMSMLHSGWGLRFIDYDNDGWKDLLIAQGHDLDTIELTSPQLRYKEPLLLARNAGARFIDVSAESGPVFHQALAGRGLATGDIDNDGKIDAVVTTNDGPAYILRNETVTQNHWLALKLTGHKSNRDAIGAEVKIVTAKGAQYSTVTTASSYLSSSDKRLLIGLGPSPVAATVEIHWPSGIVQILKDVRGDRIVPIDEPGSK